MNHLKEQRLLNHYSQEALAKKIGVSRPAYTMYETGKRTPGPEILSRLADILHVSTDYLLDRRPPDPGPRLLTREEAGLVQNYRCLDARGRATVQQVIMRERLFYAELPVGEELPADTAPPRPEFCRLPPLRDEAPPMLRPEERFSAKVGEEISEFTLLPTCEGPEPSISDNR